MEDVFNDLEKVIFAGYVDTNNKIRVRFFGLYSNGAINDITNIVTYTNPNGLVENSFGTTQNLAIRVPYGNAGQFKTYSFTLLCAVGSKQVIIDSSRARTIVSDPSATGAGQFSGSFLQLKLNDGAGTPQPVNLATLLSDASLQFHGQTPTHIRVRDIVDSTFNYTEIANSFGSSGIGYQLTPGHELYSDKAVLVEFLKISVDIGSGLVSNIFKTGALVHFIKQEIT
jgi:hypothetical protein